MSLQDDYGIITRNAEMRARYGNRLGHGRAIGIATLPAMVVIPSDRRPVIRRPDPPGTAPAPRSAPGISVVADVDLYGPRDKIIRAAAESWEVSADELLSKRKALRLSRPRQAVYLLMRQYSGFSLKCIARALGHGDHSGIVRGIKRARQLLGNDPDWRRRYEIAEAELRESTGTS